MDNNSSEVKIIAGFLASALDIEDDMSTSVYGEYLSRETWPVDLDEKVFKMITNLVTVLIEETEGHKKAFLGLKNKFVK
ncbi:MAG: hypothetical protein A3A08_01310 [Candidatus Nealsonbacteria bacterium RIFCSPLOWO2_01_FULL_41_9]|uniref:Uncharacterized protein n=1 Tax=Candidatus Nealsonbacteria bacterium RIFCSPLOWO2_01_FULL_41_9 TaxID=1801671 RepID=A0A1G2EAB7_9BACT|nr:MAG: hypothetical protein A3A08_01310 [Candidatus Nealsonbacteria bacterium RIFCSPLOWO2_01_FULL_41_9]